MATLEMVRLRSKYPNTGRMTVRHPMPLIDAPMSTINPEDLDEALREVVSSKATTTPKVAETDSSGETAVRKGGQAR
ncbi:MAG: hypothetical protein JNL54_06920 [Kineosporiaceae bacterium]|nr:hypothetical protein [Kineosporiaceae bacterium]